MQVGEICSRQTIICKPQETVLEAVNQMHRYNVGSIVVVETDTKGNKPIGIVTDRDIMLKVVLPGLKSEEVKIADVMSSKLVVSRESDDVYDVLKKMRSKVVRRIPVVDNEEYLKGILTIDDVLEFFSKELGEIISLFKKEQAR